MNGCVFKKNMREEETRRNRSLDRNENSLVISLSSTKYRCCLNNRSHEISSTNRSNYPRVRQNFARTIVERNEISPELSRSAAKYRSRSNNRTREISSKNRSKRNFANYRRIFAKFAEFRLHYFCTIL